MLMAAATAPAAPAAGGGGVGEEPPPVEPPPLGSPPVSPPLGAVGWAAAACAAAAIVVLTSDNPRSEDPRAIIDEILVGFERVGGRRIVEVDRGAAIARALELARPLDVVLIAGKGHENTQTIGTEVLPFDDRVVAQERLAELGRVEVLR